MQSFVTFNMSTSQMQFLPSGRENSTRDYNNNFFNPNICHVCKRKDSSIRCNRCHMIYYCNEGHKFIHMNQHEQFCKAIRNYLQVDERWNIRCLSREGWNQSRKDMLRLIQSNLKRDLASYEVQMITFAKSCFICHRQENLHKCVICYSCNYCDEHREIFIKYHTKSICMDMQLCLRSDISIFNFQFSLKFMQFPKCDRPVVDMKSFISHYIYLINEACKRLYSDYSSGPLTLYYGMKDSDLLSKFECNRPEGNFVVHIIATNYVDKEYIGAWELLLHLVGMIKNLKIVLIGPKLIYERNVIDTCVKCKRCKQKFTYESYGISYHHYVNSLSYESPNLIAAFHVDFSDSDKETCTKLFLQIRKQKCPFILTSKSEFKSEQNINMVAEVLDSPLNLVYHGKNRFRSNRPQRDSEHEEDGMFYRNNYLAIFINDSLYSNFNMSNISQEKVCFLYRKENELYDYNKFFNPNICHLCKRIGNDNLITCNQCRMISYCNKGHTLIQIDEHEQFCKAITNYLRVDERWNIRCLSREGWNQSRKDMLRLIQSNLKRDLVPYEVQMITLAKSCFICHRQANLHTCTICYSCNYCNEHLEIFTKYHTESICMDMQLCLKIDTLFQKDYQFLLKFFMFPNSNRPIVDMKSFISHYVSRADSTNDEDCLYSDYSSGPLTLYYGMKDSDLLSKFECNRPEGNFVVHIIATNYVDKEYIGAWELLLHLASMIENLKIVLIGPKLIYERNVINTCFKCKRCRQKFTYEFYGASYHHYVNSLSYESPNLIAAFHVDFSDSDKETCSKLFLQIRKQKCPFILTSKSEFKSEQNINMVAEVLDSPLNLVYHGKNRFRSNRPQRDSEHEEDGMFYRNNYLALLLFE
ncbi:PREDICTED: uncharacterized protein LOC106745970 [Dinoponera quadriceps]|uniref:Uncharacterized protein LOC106745970 n=1 Tax=Dinoponera quadriceps TaxID=609295 RepID=A0A6P3XHT9_DINQU|nr:PREDICTED: uncharacterized protein LOC106745970 [Dinoponera quadriceps]